MDNDVLIFDEPNGGYDDGMIALGGLRVFPMLWPARSVGIAVDGITVVMTRAEALAVARELRSMALDG